MARMPADESILLFLRARAARARAAAIGVEAVRAARDARLFYEAGGKHVLGETGAASVRRVLSDLAPNGTSTGSGGALVRAAPRSPAAASGAIAGAMGRAGAVGGLIDGAFATVVTGRRYARGEVSGKEAARHVGVEAGTGAAASALGVAAVAAVATLTGPLAPAAAFLLSGAAATGAKAVLRRAVGR